MQLNDLIATLKDKQVIGALEVTVSGITYDSRKVKPGDIFIAIPGFKVDGSCFIDDAVAKGAVAVVTESDKRTDKSVTQIVVPSARRAEALLAQSFYDHPSRAMKIVGVTGTNGKTTTTFLLDAIFTKGGNKAGLIGTIEAKIGEKIIPVEHTTPEAADLARLLRRMADEGVTHAALEVSSHALTLDRAYGVEFDVAVHTNVTHEHLDFHKTMDAYAEAKAKLFSQLGKFTKSDCVAVINADDPYAALMAKAATNRVINYGIENQSDLQAKDIKMGPQNTSFILVFEGRSYRVNLQLIGLYNVYNTLAALSAAVGLKLDLKAAIAAVEKVKNVAGRFERIETNRGFQVVVDFAHTPDGMLQLLKTVRPLVKKRIILVFGCPGSRDRAKRPLMGEVALKMSNIAIVTTDDPHAELPSQILDDIEPGILAAGGVLGRNYWRIEDRRQAITKAIRLAQPGDMVVVAGRGHETFQDFNGIAVDFYDPLVVQEILG